MLLLFGSFTLYPLLDSVRYTLFDWAGVGSSERFVGFRNYVEVVQDPFFWNAVRNTLAYACVVVPVQLLVGLTLAVALGGRRVRGRAFFRAVFLSPEMTAAAVVGVVVTVMSTTLGADVNSLLVASGIVDGPIDWLGEPMAARGVIAVAGIWMGIGFPFVCFLAGIQNVDPDLFNSAKVDGAGRWATFWRVTLPSLRPIALVLFSLGMLQSLRVFDTIQVITKGGPFFSTDAVGTYVYRYAFRVSGREEVSSDIAMASAAALVFGIMIMVFAFGLGGAWRRRERAAPPFRLGRRP